MAFTILLGYPMLEFEWDYIKQTQNIKKHGVAFSDSAASFHDPQGLEVFDTNHSLDEERYLWIENWYTRRENRIRIIGSAVLRKYRSKYYESSKNA